MTAEERGPGKHDVHEAEDYWRTRLRGFAAPTPLMVDRHAGRGRIPETNYGEREFCLSEAVTSALSELASTSGVTAYTLVQAAWAVLLSRYSREEDVVFGVARVCRAAVDDPGDMADSAANIFPVRARVNAPSSLAALVNDLREQYLRACDYEHIPLAEIQRWTDLPADVAPFETAISFHTYTHENTLRCRPGIWPNGEFRLCPILALLIQVMVYDEPRLRLKAVYDRNRLDDDAAERMWGHLGTLLDGMGSSPKTPLGNFALLPESERHRLLIEWNGTAANYRWGVCVHGLVAQQAERAPEAVALIYGEERISYHELNRRANQLAHYLRKHGAGPDRPVGIYCSRNTELVIGLLGILKAGSPYVPLDPKYPKQRIAYILEDARPDLVLTEQSLANGLPEFGGQCICLDTLRSELASEPECDPTVDTTPENLAYILFTSGSTGRPKGVAIEHGSVATFIHWAKDVFSADELAGVLCSTSVCFDLSVFEIFVTLGSGGKVILAENALYLGSLPAKDEVTLINTVPSAIAELVRMRGVPASVKTINLAGEALPDALAEEVYASTQITKLYNLYGPTEDTTYSTYTLVARGSAVTIGKPISNTQAYVLDEQRNPVPIGVPGELYLAGAG